MDRTLLALLAGSVGVALAYFGVTSRDPRAALRDALNPRAAAARSRAGQTVQGILSGLSGALGTGTAGTTLQLRTILGFLASRGMLRPGRTCGADTLAGEATSEHFFCNAKDLSITSKADGDAIAGALVAYARGGGPVNCIIWNRTIWSRSRGFAPAPYGGTNPHTDHVHVSGWPSIGGAC